MLIRSDLKQKRYLRKLDLKKILSEVIIQKINNLRSIDIIFHKNRFIKKCAIKNKAKITALHKGEDFY